MGLSTSFLLPSSSVAVDLGGGGGRVPSGPRPLSASRPEVSRPRPPWVNSRRSRPSLEENSTGGANGRLRMLTVRNTHIQRRGPRGLPAPIFIAKPRSLFNTGPAPELRRRFLPSDGSRGRGEGPAGGGAGRGGGRGARPRPAPARRPRDP